MAPLHASTMCLKPNSARDCSLMSWAAYNCKWLDPIDQLGIITNAHIADRRQFAAAAVAAMTAILAHQVAFTQALCMLLPMLRATPG